MLLRWFLDIQKKCYNPREMRLTRPHTADTMRSKLVKWSGQSLRRLKLGA